MLHFPDSDFYRPNSSSSLSQRCIKTPLKEGLVCYCLSTCWMFSLLYLSPCNCILFRCTFGAQKCNLVLTANAGQFCTVSCKFPLTGVLGLPIAPGPPKSTLSPGFRTSSGSDRDTSNGITRVDCKAGTTENCTQSCSSKWCL